MESVARSRQLTRFPVLECTLIAPRPSVSSWCPATVTLVAAAEMEDEVEAAVVVLGERPTAKLVPAAARLPVTAIPAAIATVRRRLG
ncbi:hypothetical protein GCM10022223_54800 [Kineosporia mesophila]|uniref:Uncharacterized protein n=1 Tax=Kineosporia mesophila TaxID=566012 RepID=A0ABP7AEE4_9ACTN